MSHSPGPFHESVETDLVSQIPVSGFQSLGHSLTLSPRRDLGEGQVTREERSHHDYKKEVKEFEDSDVEEVVRLRPLKRTRQFAPWVRRLPPRSSFFTLQWVIHDLPHQQKIFRRLRNVGSDGEKGVS